MFKAVSSDIINSENEKIKDDLKHDYEYLQKKLEKKNIKIDEIKNKIKNDLKRDYEYLQKKLEKK